MNHPAFGAGAAVEVGEEVEGGGCRVLRDFGGGDGAGELHNAVAVVGALGEVAGNRALIDEEQELFLPGPRVVIHSR